jgi:hypothetical protein
MPGTYDIIPDKGQSAWEIVIQEYGSVDGMNMLIEDNMNLINFFGQHIDNGNSVAIRFNAIIDKKIAHKIHPGNFFGQFFIPTTGIHYFDDLDIPINYYING